MGSDVEVDCRGMRCPMPVVELAKAVNGVEVGQVVALVADDPAAGPDVQAWCRMREQEYVGQDAAADGVPRFLVKRLS